MDARVQPGHPLIPLRRRAATTPAASMHRPARRFWTTIGSYSTTAAAWRCIAAGSATVYLAARRLRKDGFAGIEPVAADQPAVLTTKPLRLIRKSIGVNADVKGGSLRVTLLDPAGKVLAESQPITQDAVDLPVPWQNEQTLDQWQGQSVRLKFECEEGTLYSFTGLEQ